MAGPGRRSRADLGQLGLWPAVSLFNATDVNLTDNRGRTLNDDLRSHSLLGTLTYNFGAPELWRRLRRRLLRRLRPPPPPPPPPACAGV